MKTFFFYYYSFQIIFVTLFAVCSCAKLDNTYLPPPDAQNSGGNFGLAPPNQSNNGNNNGFNNGNNGFNNGNNGNNGNFGAPQNGFGQNPPQQQGFQPQQPQQPQESQQPPIAILSYENEPNYGDGSYKYSYETGTFLLDRLLNDVCHLCVLAHALSPTNCCCGPPPCGFPIKSLLTQ